MSGAIATTHQLTTKRGVDVILFTASPAVLSPVLTRLARMGVAVRCASTRRAAVEAIAEQRPDLIIVDLTPPDADARALLRRFDAKRHPTSPPIVALVPRKNPAVLRECIEVGVERTIRSPPDVDLLEASIAAVLRRRAEHLRSIRVDPLTGLLNRAGILDALKRAQGLANRTGLRHAVGMIDLDHFKDVNDGFGHAMGDRVLRGFGLLLRSALRTEDVVGRWGGEEFLVLMPNTTAANGAVALDHVREAFRKLTFSIGAERVHRLTFSAGVVDFDDAVGADDLIVAADELLYTAKSNGRNLVLDGSPSSTQSVRHALVVEDDAEQAAWLGEILRGEGLAPICVSSGDDAIRVLRQGEIDIVLLDWMLGSEHGSDILRRIRSVPELTRVPVVTVTARTDEQTVEQTFELGGDDFVRKPVRKRELLARVRHLLSRGLPPAGVSRRRARSTQFPLAR